MDKAHFLNVRRNRRQLTGGGQRKKNKSLSTTIFCGKMSWRVPYLVCLRPRWWSRWYGTSSWQRRLNGKARVASTPLMPELGGRGGGSGPPQYFADKLTLFQPRIPTKGGTFCPPFTTGTPKNFHLPASLDSIWPRPILCFIFFPGSLQMGRFVSGTLSWSSSNALIQKSGLPTLLFRKGSIKITIR